MQRASAGHTGGTNEASFTVMVMDNDGNAGDAGRWAVMMVTAMAMICLRCFHFLRKSPLILTHTSGARCLFFLLPQRLFLTLL